MLFNRRKHRRAVDPLQPEGAIGPGGTNQEFIRIEYEMMRKGSTYNRRGKTIRQFAVTVNGSTRLVTSGDVVDKKTYDALVAAGAIDARPQVDTSSGSAAEPGPLRVEDGE